MNTVWIHEKGYVLRVFESKAEAQTWLARNDAAGLNSPRPDAPRRKGQFTERRPLHESRKGR